MSFCRITGKSRGLPKPNYFPLLAPISPADAKRCCRITGKSYGLPTHHYIPVLLSGNSANRAKCKITNISGDLAPHHFSPEINYGNKKHEILPDYRYIFPILDGSTDAQKSLMKILESKDIFEDKRFVYTVNERRCSLIFSAQLEAAVRDGDVRDVMLAKDSDTILIKTKHGRNVSMDFKDFIEEVELYEGEGPTAETLKQLEKEEIEKIKKNRKRVSGLSMMKKIFEDKENLADIQEREEEKLKDRVLKKAKREGLKTDKFKINTVNYNDFDLLQMKNNTVLKMDIENLKHLVQPALDSWNWNEFENNKHNVKIKESNIDVLPKVINIKPFSIDSALYEMDNVLSENLIFVENVPCTKPLNPILNSPEEEILDLLEMISVDLLKHTVLDYKDETISNMLPNMLDATEVLKQIENGQKAIISGVSGLIVDINTNKKFIPGQYINTHTGEKFIPGQTVKSKDIQKFIPGLSINSPEGIKLLPGHILTDDESNNFFVLGQTLQTPNGKHFVQGQTIKKYNDSYKFIEGQTVLTSEGLKLIPGKIVNDENIELFIPGQTVMTINGCQFVPGQSYSNNNVDVFLPGQNAFYDDTWHFIPGQTIKFDDKSKFVPGMTIPTNTGSKFVPGQLLTKNNGNNIFVPGITIIDENISKFVPGIDTETPNGIKFVEGQICETDSGNRFFPGQIVNENGSVSFSVCNSIEKIKYHDPIPFGLPVDRNADISEGALHVFGFMVQTSMGIEFYSGPKPPPTEGKLIPGRLLKYHSGESRFVPGRMIDDTFIPGQVVLTETGEQFIPGQVIDTREGPKFVPGQVVNTKSGPKFVPGQTIETVDGPRFVPGQIIDTKAGPTFIPGQVISTEDEGSRFVPGQVVDTEEGPRFVPGRVIENSDHGVTFFPGQIVQTSEGLKFVAPDLVEGDEGLEFSVQSFVVTPEELSLLKLKSNTLNSYSTQGEQSIDSKMLRQLSEAGMAIGRQFPADIPAVDIVLEETRNKEILKIFVSEFGLKDEVANQLMEVISSIIEISKNLKNDIYNEKSENMDGKSRKHDQVVKIDNDGFHTTKTSDILSTDNHINDNIKNSIAAAVLAALVSSEQYNDIHNNNGKEKYRTILQSINTVLGNCCDENFISSMYKILQSEEEKDILCDQIFKHTSISKLEIIKLAINTNSTLEMYSDHVLEKFGEIICGHNSILGPAFKNFTKHNSDILKHILTHISEGVSFITTDDQASESLQKAIVSAVHENSSKKLDKLLNGGLLDELKEYFIQSVGLAKTLGMEDVAKSLNSILADPATLKTVANDPTSLNILKRLVIMKQLAECNPSLHTVLQKLKTDPFSARIDPNLRELVRESAALMIFPEHPPLQSSKDVPFSLLENENSLAMEEFLLKRKKHPGTLLISKKGLQAVFPREACRAVLTGQVPYTLLDESGIRHFEPLHVFSALQLNKPITYRFSMYSCPVAHDDDYDVHITSECSSSLSDDLSEGRVSGWMRKQKGSFPVYDNMDCQLFRNSPNYLNRLSRKYNRQKIDDIVVAVSDYTAVANDEISLKSGDIVEVLQTKPVNGIKNLA